MCLVRKNRKTMHEQMNELFCFVLYFFQNGSSLSGENSVGNVCFKTQHFH